MNKKIFLALLAVFVLLTLNICTAQEIENTTVDDVVTEGLQSDVLAASHDMQALQTTKSNTSFNVESTTEFDVIGDYFKVKLTDGNANTLNNVKVTFKVNGKTYNAYTDSSGIASLQIRLNDGSYNIVSKFTGNSMYNPCSLSTKITMDNTREVDSGLSNSEIQNIIDNAKPNNVILFRGAVYSNINLVIDKSLTLISNVGTTLKSSSSNPVITIRGKSASLTKVKGFNIQGMGDGIEIDGADYVTIYNNEITTKGNGIVALNTKYLNITNNDIVKNSKSGISLAKSSYAYIFNNNILNNDKNGIEIAKSKNVFIHGNTISKNGYGIYLAKTINGINFAEEPSNIQINKNTISHNIADGIMVLNAGNNINIKSNEISFNKGDGISIAQIGNNAIQSNVITDNEKHGLNFFGNYVKPAKQDISYNAIYFNTLMDVEAKETQYQGGQYSLDLGDNWYTDFSGICPKVSTKNIKFVVRQIGKNQFQAMFLDSNGNIASLLPDRILTYQTNNGKIYSVTVKGGSVSFTVDAANGDLIKAIVDNSRRDNTYNSNAQYSKPINGQSPTYSYPAIPNYQLYEDIGTGGGTGNGDGMGDGSQGTAHGGNGVANQESRSNDVNGTHSQKNDPANNPNNQANDISQNSETSDASPTSASEASQGVSGTPGAQSVAKQIIIDEDEFFKVTGISFIILLIILTISAYYREDIKEMKSKM